MRGAVWIGLLQVCIGFCMVVVVASRISLSDISPTTIVGLTVFVLGVIIMYSGIQVVSSEVENRLW